MLFKTLSASSVRHAVRAAFGVCKLAPERGRLTTNPVDHRKLRLPALNRKPTIPPKEALRAILAAVTGERGRYEQAHAAPTRSAVVLLALFGGLRRGEICGLQWGDVDFERSIIHVRRSASYHDGIKSPKTAAGYRTVPMVEPVATALRTLKGMRVDRHTLPESFVIMTRMHKRMCPTSIYGDRWRPVLIKAGIMTKNESSPYRFHALRHAAVSLLIDQGVSAMHIKSMIGHNSVSTTIDIYGHLFPSDEVVQKA